jgi:hypothetical protein
MALRGPLLQWVAQHRRHHQYSDQPGDPHTPHHHGQGHPDNERRHNEEPAFLSAVPVSGDHRILSRDLRGAGDDVTVTVSDQEIAVGDLDGSGIHADEDVHPVAMLPQLPDLNLVKRVWLTQGVQYVVADGSVPLLTLLRLLIPALLILLCRWHLFVRP